MPLFVSYSHADRDFATKLAMQLVKHKANVWIDQWELRVGDSLIGKVQQAIEGATALLVILSKASVESEWCKKELNTGLIRELGEKRVIVLPVLMEDCTIPMFLRDKMYADFRTDFDAGLKSVLESVARVTSDSLMRIEGPEWHVDWSVDWGPDKSTKNYFLHLTAIEQSTTHAFSVLTQVHISANDIADKRYEAMKAVDLDWLERTVVINMLAESAAAENARLRIEDEKAQRAAMTLNDGKTGCRFEVEIITRRVGEDNGQDILIDLGGQLRSLSAGQISKQRKLTKEEQAYLRDIQKQFDTNNEDPFSFLKY